jgi:alkylation response protein AidB-like acyl-CoA dehydrogenase
MNTTNFAPVCVAFGKSASLRITPSGKPRVKCRASCGKRPARRRLLGVTVPTEYNGLGLDVLYAAIGWGEQHVSGCTGPGFALHAEIVAPYIMHYGSEAQKKHFLPPMVAGDMITAIAMTEPGAGSDLQGMKTTARVDGGDLVLNGSKTYITNGVLSDMVIVCARTDPTVKAAKGISLLLVETSMKGFKKGRRLDKIGLKAQDTSELYFDDVRVPIKTHLLGPLNRGFVMLMEQLPQERMMIAEMGVSAAEAVFEHTRTWCKERMAFGKPLLANQVVAHKLAKMKIDIVQTRLFVDKCLQLLCAGQARRAHRMHGQGGRIRFAESHRRRRRSVAWRTRLHGRRFHWSRVCRCARATNLRRIERGFDRCCCKNFVKLLNQRDSIWIWF